MGTTTTIVKPNYTYAGGPARTIRKDSAFEAPQIKLGGARSRIERPQILKDHPTRYGVAGEHPEMQGERMFFSPSEAPENQMTGGDNGEPLNNPSVAPVAAASQRTPMFQNKYGGAPVAAAAPVADPGPVRVAQKSQRQPIVTNDDGGDDIGAILGGVAQLGGAVGAGKEAATNDMLAAGAGAPLPKADTSLMGRSKDFFTGMFGGPTRANIDAAYQRSKIDPVALPSAPQLEGGEVNGMQVGGTAPTMFQPIAPDSLTSPEWADPQKQAAMFQRRAMRGTDGKR